MNHELPKLTSTWVIGPKMWIPAVQKHRTMSNNMSTDSRPSVMFGSS